MVQSGGFVMPIFTVSIAFELSEGSWQVSRAHTVVATCASCRDAIGCACDIAAALRRRMHCDMRLRVKDRHGYWHVYASIGGDGSAAALASHVFDRLGSATPDLPVARMPDEPFVFYARAKSFPVKSGGKGVGRRGNSAVVYEAKYEHATTNHCAH